MQASVLSRILATTAAAWSIAPRGRRRPLELGGWHLAFDAHGRASSFVSQTMLNTRGNFVG